MMILNIIGPVVVSGHPFQMVVNLDHFPKDFETTTYQVIQSDLFIPLVGGDLTFERVTSPSQKGHKDLPGSHKNGCW